MPGIDRLAIVGVGLLGGSIARAARDRFKTIIGIDSNFQALGFAKLHGIIDIECDCIIDGVHDCDVIVICTPVNSVASIARQVLSVVRSNAIVTDVGSTKANILQELAGQGNDGPYFVGSHPLAGSEHSGIEHSDGTLFRNRLVLTTPTPESSEQALAILHQFWQSLGAKVEAIDAETHDRILAQTSHLPHVLASALAGMTPVEILKYTAGGWRDTTRIAAGTPSMWTPILQANRNAILTTLRQFQARLGEFERMLEANNGDEMTHWLEEAKKVRDALGS